MFSSHLILVVHINQVFTNIQKEIGNFIFETLSEALFGIYLLLKCWDGHEFLHCAMGLPGFIILFLGPYFLSVESAEQCF